MISGFRLAALAEPEALAIHFEDVDVVGQSVEDRAGQAEFLIEVLSEERPEDLAEAYEDAMEKGPHWRARLEASLSRMSETRDRLDALR